MTEDATLTEFLAANGAAEEADGERGGEDGARRASGERDETGGDDAGEGRTVEDERDVDPNDRPSTSDSEREAAEPAVSTYAWGEYACARCGERTVRVWRDDGSLVCPDCKPW